MERKPKPEGYIEPMPQKLFFKLMKDFKALGGLYIANDDSERYLDIRGVEADTLNATTILFRKKPTRAAVYEELFHSKQYREGKIQDSALSVILCEIEAQEYLLKNANELHLTQPEINQTENALAWYKSRLKILKGDESNDNL